MGLPQGVQPQPPPPSSSSTSSSDALKDPAGLPPEAIALATRLFDFARQGDTRTLSQYIQAGIPANLTNHKGDTLLMLAAYHGHPETVAMLISRGADVNCLNDRGQSPVAGAVFKGYDEVVRVLVQEGGADVWAGQPCAVDAGRMFKREGALRLMGYTLEEEGSSPQGSGGGAGG